MGLSKQQFSDFAKVIEQYLKNRKLSEITPSLHEPVAANGIEGRLWSSVLHLQKCLNQLNPELSNVQQHQIRQLQDYFIKFSKLNSFNLLWNLCNINISELIKIIEEFFDTIPIPLQLEIYGDTLKAFYYTFILAKSELNPTLSKMYENEINKINLLQEKCKALMYTAKESSSQDNIDEAVLSQVLKISSDLQHAEKQIFDKIAYYNKKYEQLDKLENLTIIQEQLSQEGFKKFWEYFNEKKTFKKLLHLLWLPQEEKKAWLTEYEKQFGSYLNPLNYTFYKTITLENFSKALARAIDKFYFMALCEQRMLALDQFSQKLPMYQDNVAQFMRDYSREQHFGQLLNLLGIQLIATKTNLIKKYQENNINGDDLDSLQQHLKKQVILLSQQAHHTTLIISSLSHDEKLSFCLQQNLKLQQKLEAVHLQIQQDIRVLYNPVTMRVLKAELLKFTRIPNLLAYLFSKAYRDCFDNMKILVKSIPGDLSVDKAKIIKNALEKASQQIAKEQHYLLTPEKRLKELSKFFEPGKKSVKKENHPPSLILSSSLTIKT